MTMLSFVGFIALSFFAYSTPIWLPEVGITREIQNGIFRYGEPFLVSVSVLGGSWVAVASVAVASVLFFAFALRLEALFALFILLGDGMISAIKFIIGRPRPDSNLVSVIQPLSDPGFPSIHVFHYVLFFGFLYVYAMLFWKPDRWVQVLLTVVFFGLIISVSISRIYLGVHGESDVVGGFLYGF